MFFKSVSSRAAVIAFSGAAVLAIGFPTAAQAEEGTMRVRVADLNVSSEAGARAAFKRIHMAARVFCQVPAQYSLDPAYAKCRRQMVGKAVTQLDAPQVTALYESSVPTRLAAR